MGTNYHPTCTCAIGRVVDSDLRVFGTGGLRVIDASVIPPSYAVIPTRLSSQSRKRRSTCCAGIHPSNARYQT
jgi:choline dehydrogenase-like flavoprotein